MDKKKIFYIFLIINALLWSVLGLVRNIIGNDALEAISWGELIDFGTNKHPPLSGWLMGGFYHLLGQNDFAAYFLGQICILIGFIYIYKLAKFFFDEEHSICASLLMTPCYYYTYIAFYENFNCNFLSMALWPMIAYYFYKSVKKDKIFDWILFGLVCALGLLTKYQIIFLYFALFIYLLICDRKQFRKKGMYLAILTGLCIILPHIIWLFRNDFFPFSYMLARTEVGIHNTPPALVKYGRIIFPIKFIADQILSVIACVVLYGIIAFQAKNISFKNLDIKLSDKLFISLISFGPIIMQASIGIFSNSRIQGMWGSMMVSFFGLFLLSFSKIKFKETTFNFFMKCTVSLALIWMSIMFLFNQFQTKLHMSFPYQTVIPEINKIWDTETNSAKLEYVGGCIDYVFKIKQYNPRHPKAVLETFGHENPWIKSDELLKSGIIIFGYSKDEILDYAKFFGFKEDNIINIHKYNFVITNKIGGDENYEFYYAIIPPN